MSAVVVLVLKPEEAEELERMISSKVLDMELRRSTQALLADLLRKIQQAERRWV